MGDEGPGGGVGALRRGRRGMGVAHEVEAQQVLVDGGRCQVDVLAAVGEDQPERHPVLEEGVDGSLVDGVLGKPGGELAGEGGGGVRLVEQPEGSDLGGCGEFQGAPVEGVAGG